MRRREFIRAASALAGGAVVGAAAATEAFARRGTTVQQVSAGGVPQPRSVLTVRTTEVVDVVDPDRIHVTVPIVDPAAGETTARRVDVVDASATNAALRLVVDGPVSRGSVVSFGERALLIDGRGTDPFSHTLDGSLAVPERATLWFKAYEPANVDWFGRGVYRGEKPPRRGRPDDDPAAVRARLAAHLDRFVDRGRLTAAERDASLARFDSPATRARFVDSGGGFDAVALAGVLANAGTVARGIDAVILDGANRFDRPYAVRRRPTRSGGLMEVRVDGGEPVIFVDPALAGEPFAVLAPLFAHEGLHQDLAVGLSEEIIATYLETLVWAEHVLSDPTLARLGTPKVRRANTLLLIALNSGGRSFPEMGLHAAPHRQRGHDATPDATESVPDFVTAVASRYRRTAPGATPGVPYARQVVERVTGAAPSDLDFDDETLDLLDGRTRLFDTEEALRLLAALELRPATAGEVPSNADPVAVSDATWNGSVGTPDPVETSPPDDTESVYGCGTCLRAATGSGTA
ncbi:hypothetical protein [Salinigranum marinum]|uniref:hypothetical protein n=1 Tax=Salinigranum marinum TaxID=1515595 RepID=UPI002989B593|nr:hypothetical protein [Salinigranum marinum]